MSFKNAIVIMIPYFNVYLFLSYFMAFVFYCSPFSNNLTVDAPYRHSNIDSATELLSAVSLCSLCSSRSSNLQTAQVPVKLSIEGQKFAHWRPVRLYVGSVFNS